MKISVVIPTYNDEKDLDDCLSSLEEQTVDFELVIIDGHSTDGTVDIAEEYGARIFYEDYGTPGGARYVGSKEASGDIIVHTDADATFPPDWLEKIKKKFENTEIDVLGGEDIVKNGSDFENALFAIDKAASKPREGDVWRRIRGVNSAYRREALLEENFNPKQEALEEPELQYRLKEKGFSFGFYPEIINYHPRRKGLKSLFKQFFRNGKGRARALKKHSEMLSFGIDLAPLGLFLLLLGSVLVSIFCHFALLVTVGVLLLVSVGIPLSICKKSGDWWAFGILFIAFPTRWMGFSLGFIRGLL